jgi:hypothetical protein
MEERGSPASSMNSAGTGDTGQLLQELMNYSNFINAVKRQRNLGLVIAQIGGYCLF